jgi:ABC-type polysaccharide/polyol phosphate export permease/Tfp pilus assembly protein PilF
MPDADTRVPVVDSAISDCRLAEMLLHQGRAEEAAECCRRAWPQIGDDASLLRICAWVFSNAACHDEAAAAYRRLLAVCPEWADGHRHLSAALAAAGHAQAAIAPAMTASDQAPDEPEFALHAAQLLIAAQCSAEATRYLDRALAHAAGEPRVIADAGELLMQCGRAAAAAELLAAADAGDDARLLRVLSAAEMSRGQPIAALAAIDRALALAPDNAEYHLHRGHLLWQLDDLAGAAQAFEEAAVRDPDGSAARRAQTSLYLAAGLVREATTAGGELLQRWPDERGSAEAVLHVLNHRLDTIDGDVVVIMGAARQPPAPRPTPAWWERLRTQRRVIRALIIRETRTRFADYKLGYGWALLEPILHIALLSVMFAVLMHSRPPIGRHFFLFYYTGLIPYLMFVHTSSGMSHAITGNAPLLRLPPVTSFDAIAARGLLEIMTDVVVAIILLVGFMSLGLAQMPDDLWGPSMALLVTAALGCGLGFVNAVMTVFWRSWEKAYNQVLRVLYFISGIFYVPAMMPEWARHVLAWNPLLHAVDWFRAGFFASYQPHWLDRPYLVILATVALLGGLSLQRCCRRRLSVPL